METVKKINHKLIIWAITIVGIAALSFAAYQNPELFKADLSTGAETTPAGYTLYIPNDYTANQNDVGELEVKAAVDMNDIESFSIFFQYTVSKISINGINTESGDYFHGVSAVSVSNAGKSPFGVQFQTDQMAAVTGVTAGDTLFRLEMELLPDFRSGKTTIGATFGSNSYCATSQYYYYFCAQSSGGGGYITSPEFRNGVISVISGAPLGEGDICEQLGDCSGNGYCDGIQCVCDPEYDGARCNTCKTGFTGYPDCTESATENMKVVILTLADGSIEDETQAYSTAYLMLNSSVAAGQSITIEGNSVAIPTPDATEFPDCSDDSVCINAIINDPDNDGDTSDGLADLLEAHANVARYPEAPGLLKLEALDDSLEGIVSGTGEVKIVPGIEDYVVTLPADQIYQLEAYGKFSDGSMMELDFKPEEAKMMPETNILEYNELAKGLLKKGEANGGEESIYAEIEKASGPNLSSNHIIVDVPRGPTIEYMRRVGSSPIVKGGRVTYTVKVSDVDQIADIQDIQTSVVRSTYDTYSGINADSNAVWFTATPFPNEVTVSDSGSETPEGETASQYFKVYSIPVEIPQDANLTDGPYKIVLSITDSSNNQSNVVKTVEIGNVANGDVNNDGNVTMLDVIMAFQIATGENNSPTASEIQGADMNNNGSVTMLDVVTLFEQVNQ